MENPIYGWWPRALWLRKPPYLGFNMVLIFGAWLTRCFNFQLAFRKNETIRNSWRWDSNPMKPPQNRTKKNVGWSNRPTSGLFTKKTQKRIPGNKSGKINGFFFDANWISDMRRFFFPKLRTTIRRGVNSQAEWTFHQPLENVTTPFHGTQEELDSSELWTWMSG